MTMYLIVDVQSIYAIKILNNNHNFDKLIRTDSWFGCFKLTYLSVNLFWCLQKNDLYFEPAILTAAYELSHSFDILYVDVGVYVEFTEI